jgi:ubiquinone/menaquinone biosynthesis C-methylase UbiE
MRTTVPQGFVEKPMVSLSRDVRQKDGVMFRQDCWRGFNVEQAREAARLAEVSGWQVASHDYMRLINPSAYRMAVDENRTQLRFLLPLTNESCVLNLGCGWGSLALNLAICTGCAIGMDSCVSTLRFAVARGKQMEVAGFYAMRGRLCQPLPFADATFDAVIMLDRPERYDLQGIQESKRTRQELLVEIRRVLKPGGSAMWGVSNRLGLGHPPVASGWQLRTYWGYVRSLHNAGFQALKFFAALPSHLEPYFILPAKKLQLVDFLIEDLFTSESYRSKIRARGLGLVYQVGRNAWRLGRRFGVNRLVPYLFPSYLIVAS